MSITANPQTPQEKLYGFAPQAEYGTAIADNAAFTELDCEPTEIQLDVKELEVPGAHATRTPKISSIIHHTNGSAPIIPISTIAKHDELDYFLYSAMGAVVEGESTPYDKTFTVPATQPNFAIDAGMFLTIIERDPTASHSQKVVDAISQSLELTIEAGGVLKVNQTWQGRGAATLTANPSGTWTRSALDLWHFEALDRVTVNFGGGAVSFHLQSFGLTIAQDLVFIGQDGTASFQNVGLTNRKLEWSLKIVKDDDFDTALTNWSGDTAVDVNVGWGNATPGTVDGDLDFAIHGKINSVTKDHGDVMAVELSGVCLESDDGNTEALTVVMANAVDRAW